MFQYNTVLLGCILFLVVLSPLERFAIHITRSVSFLVHGIFLITCRAHDGGERSRDTMVSRAHSTLDGHPEVKQRKAIQVFPVSD